MSTRDVQRKSNEVSVFVKCVEMDPQFLEFYDKAKCAKIRKFLKPENSWRLWIRFDDVATFVGCSEKELFNRLHERLGKDAEVHFRLKREDKL